MIIIVIYRVHFTDFVNNSIKSVIEKPDAVSEVYNAKYKIIYVLPLLRTTIMFSACEFAMYATCTTRVLLRKPNSIINYVLYS